MSVIPDGARLIDRLPRPLQRVHEAINIITPFAALAGWLASTTSLIGKMTFWQPIWDAILDWSVQFPAWVESALLWIGAQCHWLAELYRQWVRPVFEWLLSLLPFDLPPIAVDLISIACFAVFGFLRVRQLGRQRNCPSFMREPFSFCARSGVLFPIMIVQVLPLALLFRAISAFDAVDRSIGGFTDWVEQKVGNWAATTVIAIIAFPALAAFPLSIFATEWLYITVT
jgi:hypothetical protein